MKCLAFAISDKIDINNLNQHLTSSNYNTELFDDVIYTVTDQANDKNYQGSIFIFSYGCVVFWNVLSDFRKDFINTINKYSSNHYDYNLFAEEVSVNINSNQKTNIVEEENLVILESDDIFTKLAISHAISQSVKLEYFEVKIVKTINDTKPISNELSNTGKVSLSKQDLTKLIGQLFAERNTINLEHDILDLPEFFWRRPKYEQIYLIMTGYLDLNTRLDILNRRLDAIHELYDILSNELNHLHSSRLEMIVIYLITAEVVIGIAGEIARWLGV
jgi:uncharacterized Rmd1/YagE family protein